MPIGRKGVDTRRAYALQKVMGLKDLQARKGCRPERATGQKGQWA